MTILSDPATNVQVLLDNKRVPDGKGVPIDATPAVLPLGPGSYVLTVQRDGYVPWNQPVELKAGEHLTVRAKLEPLASTGFTLVSDPPGATAILDNKALDGLTPLRVESMLPGKHRIEVRSAAGQWSQEVTVEAGRMIDLHAVLGAVAVAPVAAQWSRHKPVEPAAAPPAVAKAPAPSRPRPRRWKKSRRASRSRWPPSRRSPRPSSRVAARSRASCRARRRPNRWRERTSRRRRPSRRSRPRSRRAARATTTTTATWRRRPRPSRSRRRRPSRPPPAPPSRRAASGEGSLRLGSKPWTNISIDGKDTGLHTPQLKIKLAAGSHRITLTNPQFNIKETFSVEIKAGAEETVIKDLRQNNDDSD